MSLIDIDKRIGRLEDKIKQYETDLQAAAAKQAAAEVDLALINEAIEVLTAVLSITQEKISDFIERMVSEALQYVYGVDYGFKVIFKLQRNQPEIHLHPTKNGHLYNPKFSCGIGVLDVCAFVLRYICWALSGDKYMPVMIQDEPFRNVHGEEENEKLSQMVKRMSELLKLQIIIVSGESALTAYADCAYNVSLDSKGTSVVRKL